MKTHAPDVPTAISTRAEQAPAKTAGVFQQRRLGPVVTVGIPVYNGERYLRDAVESVLAQTFRDFEIVIADNASTDGTRQICEEFVRRDPRVRYVRNARNIGAISNFRKVVSLARGEYFKWLCHDDYIACDFLEACLSALEYHADAVTASPDIVVVDSGRQLIRQITRGLAVPCTPPSAVQRYRAIITACLADPGGGRRLFEKYIYGLHRTALLRRTRLLGAFMESDFVLAAELALIGDIIEIDRALCFLRVPEECGSNQLNYIARDWRAVQDTIDPTAIGPMAVLVSRLRRYPEHVAAVLLSPLPLQSKCQALPVAVLPARQRLSRRGGRSLDGAVAATQRRLGAIVRVLHSH